MIKKSLLFSSILLCAQLSAQQVVTNPQKFLGYNVGEKFTPHYKIVNYFNQLAKEAPTKIKVQQYGITNEGKPLIYAIVSTPENMANIESIRLNNLKLAGIENGGGEINGKAIVWLSYNVHGNEASSSEASMATAYSLVNDAKCQDWLKNAIVILDPCLNPDGRDRYVNWYNSMLGKQMDVHPNSREHLEPWPGGRSNHYYFDLNRDWAWQTQVESQQRAVLYHQWLPQIHVDYHEQGYNEPYFFAPAAEPIHDVITPWQRNFALQIGKNNARYFDQNNWLYFTKERFDLFYPSYGDTYPTYNGAIGMTYEQGGHSRGGLGIVNEDGDTLTLVDRAKHHYTTGLATLEISAQNANELQKNFKQFFDNAKTSGIGDYKSFVLKYKGNEARIPALLELLDRNKIQYSYSGGGTAKGYNYFTNKEESFSLEKGDIVISTIQPFGNMAKVLFEPKSNLKDSVTYDITAWAMPYAYGINGYAVKEKLATDMGNKPVVKADTIGNAYAYIKTWKSMEDARFLAACLKEGIKVRMSERPFEYGSKKYQPGSLIFIKTSNQSVVDFYSKIKELAAKYKVSLEAVTSGFVDKGADFGSPDVKMVHAPKIAVLLSDGVSSLNGGAVWDFFDNDLGYPASMLNISTVSQAGLSGYDVLVLPEGNYGKALEKNGVIHSWVQRGGKLIAFKRSVNQLVAGEWGIETKKDEEDKKDKKDPYEILKPYGNAEREQIKHSNAGTIYKMEIDNTHPLAFGYPDYYYTLKADNNIFSFMENGWNVGVIKKDSKVAGFNGIHSLNKLKDGVLFGEVPTGRGSVVFFTDDVLFRNFWQNGKLFMANAIFMVNQGNKFTL
ncbi:M14 metallopeptidase family protein [Polluticaenibacter yanchengensis]|uniref:M14 family metallopeptidase n=1 Tax=Polluticaenibacter yanchengensis TaxID=3014562 RepID=A0ABT4UFZ3_9BACT|nr:M14 family metallopeptidase [Chitinophagaceae bacterium LY-5]